MKEKQKYKEIEDTQGKQDEKGDAHCLDEVRANHFWVAVATFTASGCGKVSEKLVKTNEPESVLHPKGRREENGTKNGEEPAEDLAHSQAETPLRADRIVAAGFNCGCVLLVRRLFPVALLVDEDSGVSTEPLLAVISPAVVVPGADSAAAAAADSSSLGAKWAGFLLRRGFSLFVSSACDPAACVSVPTSSSVSSSVGSESGFSDGSGIPSN